jgi:hypothetical protein
MDGRYTSECGRSRSEFAALEKVAGALPLMPSPIRYFVNGQPLLAAVG